MRQLHIVLNDIICQRGRADRVFDACADVFAEEGGGFGGGAGGVGFWVEGEEVWEVDACGCHEGREEGG